MPNAGHQILRGFKDGPGLQSRNRAGGSKAREVSRAGSRQQGSYLPAPFSPGKGLKASSPPPHLDPSKGQVKGMAALRGDPGEHPTFPIPSSAHPQKHFLGSKLQPLPVSSVLQRLIPRGGPDPTHIPPPPMPSLSLGPNRP